MASADKDSQGIPWVVFIPIILCVVGILVLLDIRQRQRNPQYGNVYGPRDDLTQTEMRQHLSIPIHRHLNSNYWTM